jgi:hypothetical protein
LSLGMSIAQRLALMSSLVRLSSRGFALDLAVVPRVYRASFAESAGKYHKRIST